MANIEKTNQSPFGYLLRGDRFEAATFTAAGAATYPAGLVLGRITATGKLIPYAAAAADGSEFPSAVLHEEIVATGAGDHSTRVLIVGETREGDTRVWNAGVPIAMTGAERDKLRRSGVTAVPVDQLNGFDN